MATIPWRTIVHYRLYFVVPFVLALFFRKDRRVKAYFVMLATMVVDVDLLLANPIFDPIDHSLGRFSFGKQFSDTKILSKCVAEEMNSLRLRLGMGKAIEHWDKLTEIKNRQR